MVVYFTISLIAVLLATLCTFSQRQYQGLFLIILICFLTFFAGCRAVGTDYFNYLYRFEGIDFNFFPDNYSIIYSFMKLVKRLGGNYQVVTVCIAFLTLLINISIYWKYRNIISFPMAVFSYMMQYYLMSFNVFRQVLASSIFLLAIVELSEKHKKSSILYYIVACLVHSSIIPFGLIFIIKRWLEKPEYWGKRIFMYMCILLIVLTIPLYGVKIMPSGLMSHYGYYLVNFKYQPLGFGIFRYVFLAIIPVIFINIWERGSNKIRDAYSNMWYLTSFSIIGFELWLLSYVSASSAYRLSVTLLISLPILHGFIVKNSPKKWVLFISVFLILSLIVFWLYDCAINSGDVIPYKFFFSYGV